MGRPTDATLLTNQVAIGTGSPALKNKINPSLPLKATSLDSLHSDGSGRSTTAKESKSDALAKAA